MSAMLFMPQGIGASVVSRHMVNDTVIDMAYTLLWLMACHCQKNLHDNSHLLIMHLTHWGRDKMAAIFQTTFSNAFSWMKMY